MKQISLTKLCLATLCAMTILAGLTVYAQEDEDKPRPQPPVPAEYQNKKMPDGGWTNAALIAIGEKVFQEGVEITTPEGKEVQKCAQCHGPQGKPKLKGARDFRDAGRINKFGEAFWFWRVSEGVTGTKMPAWKGILTEEQIWGAMAYEHRFSHGGEAAAHQHGEIVGPNGEK